MGTMPSSLGPVPPTIMAQDLPSIHTAIHTCPATPAELYVLKQAPSTLAAGPPSVSPALCIRSPTGILVGSREPPFDLRDRGATCTMSVPSSPGELGIWG